MVENLRKTNPRYQKAGYGPVVYQTAAFQSVKLLHGGIYAPLHVISCMTILNKNSASAEVADRNVTWYVL